MKLLTSKKLRRGSISFGARTFDRKTSKAREARVHFYFNTASAPPAAPFPVTMPHSLGRVPTSYSVVGLRRSSGAAPGSVFDVYPWATRNHITLHCSTDNTIAEVIVR